MVGMSRRLAKYGEQHQVNACVVASNTQGRPSSSVISCYCNKVMYVDNETGLLVFFPNAECSVDKCETSMMTRQVLDLRVSQFQYVNVVVNGSDAVALCDSGSQIPVVRSRLYKVDDDNTLGIKDLQGIVGQAIKVPISKHGC